MSEEPDHPVRALGRRIEEARRRRGLTYRELAERAGMSKSNLHYLIWQRLTAPGYYELVAVVRGLGESWDEQWESLWQAVAGIRMPRSSDGPQSEQQGDQAASERASPDGFALMLLPADVPAFVGRSQELAQLDAAISPTAGRAANVVVVSGTAGVGKTAFVVHWAHRVCEYFPDGHLYLNMRGFDASGEPLTPADAARRFLEAFQVPPQHIPAGLDAQIDLYRNRVAGRRILVVLDNVRDAQQILPLLPDTSAGLAVIASRNQHAGLIAATAAVPLILDRLTLEQSRGLLAHRIGTERINTAPQAVEEIITRCARLPLALALVAARAAIHPTFPLAKLAAELDDATDRLDALDCGDPPIRAVFSWSYRQMTRPAARLFRQLAQHAGPEISVPVAAAIAGTSVRQARQALTELAHAHLLEEPRPGRYAYHDLLRAYATELAHTVDSKAKRSAAGRRLADHYLHTGHAAAMKINPARAALTLDPPVPSSALHDFADDRAAMEWFEDEHLTLAAVARQASAMSRDAAWQLAWTLADFLDRHGRWHEMAAIYRTALEPARRSGDMDALARTHGNLGRAYRGLGEHAAAVAQFHNVLTVFEELNDRPGQARAHLSIAQIHEDRQHYDLALRHARQSLDLAQTTGNTADRARSLNAVGWFAAQLGDYATTLTHCRQARNLHRRTGDQHGQAAALDSLAYAEQHLGHLARAIRYYQQAQDLFKRSGDLYKQAETLDRLGTCHLDASDPESAHCAWSQALAIFDHINHSAGAHVRKKLKKLQQNVIKPP